MPEATRTIEHFPALKSQVGKWVYYLTAMPFREVAARVKKLPRKIDNLQLHIILQREVTESRLSQISTYLTTVEEHFFNSIVVGVEGGDPQWYPVEISDNGPYGPLRIDSSVYPDSLGVLELDGTEQMFTIDGQHRVEGIRKALMDDESLGADMLPVIIVAHLPTTSGFQRTRRLFSTLNRYARQVSEGDRVLLDEDDGYAIATRELVRSHWALSKVDDQSIENPNWMVAYATTAQIHRSSHSFTTLVTLYKHTKTFFVARGRERTELGRRRPSDEKIDEIHGSAVEYWDAVAKFCGPVSDVFASVPGDGTVAKYRGDKGGSIMLRPAGQMAFCEAARIMAYRKVPVLEAVHKLSEVQLSLNDKPWRNVLWDGKKMMTANPKLNRNLLLHMVGEPEESKGYSVLDDFRIMVNDDKAELGDIVKFDRVQRRKIVGLDGKV